MRLSHAVIVACLCGCSGGCAPVAEPGGEFVGLGSRSASAWSVQWQGCRQSVLHLQQPREEVQARLPAGWRAASVLSGAPAAGPLDRGRVSLSLYRCDDDGAGRAVFGGMIGLLVDAPAGAPGSAEAEYYAIAAYSSDATFLGLLNESWYWAFLALSIELEVEEGPYLIGTAGLSANDATTMSWAGSGMNRMPAAQQRHQRWWRALPAATVSLSFSGRTASASGLVHYCEFSDGSLAEYATGQTWCKDGDGMLEQFPAWPDGLRIEWRHYPRDGQANDF